MSSFATQYVDTAIEKFRQHNFMHSPDPLMPEEMRDQDLPSDNNWIPWKPIASTVTDLEISQLQEKYGGPLPPDYITFLKYRHFYVLTERGIRFEPHILGRWKQTLENLYDDYTPHFPEGSHLIPFGHEAFMDAGPVCFDFSRRTSDGDCAIVFWDHEWVNTDSEIQLLFSSTTKMFESLLFIASSPVDFCYHDAKRDDADRLPEKQRLLSHFLKIDPSGAGGPARKYWTCWGVTPSE